MLNITRFSTFCVNLDYYADYIPILSSATNLIDFFLKYAVRPQISETNLIHNHYFAYLDTKEPIRSIFLLIPVLGNILVPILNICYMIEAEKAEKLAEYYNTNSAYDKAAEFYEEAANWGSVNAKYQFATFLQQGKGLSTPYPNSAKEQFRQAAALGCPKSQHALAQFSN